MPKLLKIYVCKLFKFFNFVLIVKILLSYFLVKIYLDWFVGMQIKKQIRKDIYRIILMQTLFKRNSYKNNQFNGLDWSLLVKHLVIKDIHNSWLYCVPSSRGLVKQYNQELCISLISYKNTEVSNNNLHKY